VYILHYSAGGEVLSIKIGVEEISNLYLHEETVSRSLDKLLKAFKKSRFQIHPIIVDERSKVVLDGMHRVSVMRELGYKRIVVCLVDYYSNLIKVKNWYRVFRNVNLNKAYSLIKDFCYKKNLALREVSFKDYELKGVPTRSIDIVCGDRVFIIEGPNSVYNLYRMVFYLDGILKTLSNSIEYLPEKDALALVDDKNIVEKTPAVTKEEVIKVALSGKVFPPKTTRHIIPVRPLFVNIPLSLLKKELELDELNEIVRKILLQKRLVKIKGKIYLDRFYEENHLYLFI